MARQVQSQHEMSTLMPQQENCSLLIDLFSQQDIPMVTDFNSSVAAFEQILGSLEHFTIHHTNKTVKYCGLRCRYIDIRDLFGSTIFKIIHFPDNSAKVENYGLNSIHLVFLDSSDRFLMQAARFKDTINAKILLFAGEDPLGFVTEGSGLCSTDIKYTVETESNSEAVPAVPTSDMKMEVKGYTGCFCSCYNCGTDKPGGIRFHSIQSRQNDQAGADDNGNDNDNVRELLADMENLSKREYIMMSRGWDESSGNRAGELDGGISQLHIWANVPTLLKMWILYLSVNVFESSFKKDRCCCCLVRTQLWMCWCVGLVLFIILLVIIVLLGGIYKLFDIVFSLGQK